MSLNLKYLKTFQNRGFFRFKESRFHKLDYSLYAKGVPINKRGDKVLDSYYYVQWGVGAATKFFGRVDYHMTKLKYPFKRIGFRDAMTMSVAEKGPIWYRKFTDYYYDLASSRGSDQKIVDIRKTLHMPQINKLFNEISYVNMTKRNIGGTHVFNMTPTINRQGSPLLQHILVGGRPFKVHRRDAENETQFFKSKEFFNWYYVFLRAVLNMKPNDSQGNVYFRVSLYADGGTSGNKQTGVHVTTMDINNRIIDNTTYFSSQVITVRLSHFPDILMMGVYMATSKFCLRFYTRYVEKYEEDDDRYDSLLRRVKYVKFSMSSKLKMSILTIRSGGPSTLSYLLSGYKTHENLFKRYNFKLFKKYIKDNNLKIVSPRTRLHCIPHCFIIAKNKEFHDYYKAIDDKKLKMRYKNKVSTIVKKIGILYTNAECIFKKIASLYYNTRITVFNFGMEVVWDSKKYQKNLKENTELRKTYNNNTEHIEFVVGRGHCFCILPRGKDDKSYFVSTLPRIKKLENVKLEAREKALIQNNAYKTKEYNTVVFDIETLYDTDKPYACGWKINDQKIQISYSLGCMEDFLYDLLQSRQNFSANPIFIFAHNGGGFDFHFFLDELLKIPDMMVNVSSCLEINGSIIEIRFNVKTTRVINGNKNKTIYRKFILKDSLPIFAHIGLGTLTTDFKVEHEKGEVPHHKINSKNFYEYEEKVVPYLTNDVLGLREVLFKYRDINIQKWGIDPLTCATAASFSRQIFFKHAYNIERFPLYRLHDSLDTIIRLAYYGGRVECGSIGLMPEGQYYYYDYTSLYPSCMEKGLPYGIPMYVKEFTEEFYGVCHCRVVFTDTDVIPILPIRSDSGLIFPYFEKPTEGYWWSSEIRLAIKHGYQVEFIEGWHWTKAQYYKELTQELFEMKLEATENNDKGLKRIAKILINSSYGFWATRYQEINKIVFESETQNNLNPQTKYIELDSLLSHLKKGKLHIMRIKDRLDIPYVYSAISTAIACEARIKLWNLLHDIREDCGFVYYMDTDSVVTDYRIEGSPLEAKYMGKEKGRLLGQLKSEFGYGKYATSLVVGGPKIYGFKGDIPKEFKTPKFKGFYKKRKWYKKVVYEQLKKKMKDKNIVSTDKVKIIDFTSSPKGTDSLTFEDLVEMVDGTILRINTYRISGKTTAWMSTGVSKIPTSISFKVNYKKGIMYPNGHIAPFTLK